MTALLCLAAMFAMFADSVLKFVFRIVNLPFAFGFVIMVISKCLRWNHSTQAPR
jgi:hypothetical protein